jgi:hypothetical protein
LIERRAASHLPRITAMAGGIAVAYVALYLLPKIGDYTAVFVSTQADLPELLQYRLYWLFLTGLVVYFLVDRTDENRGLLPVWLHGGAFTLYSFLTAYVLADVPRSGYFPYVFAGMALSLHFVGICHHLRARHHSAFDDYIRWSMCAAVFAGWTAGTFSFFSSEALATLVAFLGGGILVNVLREEWPESGRGGTVPFLIGVALFTLLAIAVRTISGGRT